MTTPAASPPPAPPVAVRLQKLLADAGLGSRRSSEELILAGRVQVNGQTIRELGTRVDPERDRVAVDGRPVRARQKVYLALNKPRGYLCSRSDPDERPLAGDLLPGDFRHLFPVGRLDYDSEGLLFFTNDGEFCLRLTHPRYGVRKRYLVTLPRPLPAEHRAEILRGVYVDNEKLRADRVHVLNPDRGANLVELELTEGKNREVRRLFAALGHRVERLKRIAIGSIRLDRLPTGKWRRLSPSEVRLLLRTAAPSPRPAGRSMARSPSRTGRRAQFHAQMRSKGRPQSSARLRRPLGPRRDPLEAGQER